MGFLKRPKAPEPTAQELAIVERQSRRLDEEIEEQEKRLKAIACSWHTKIWWINQKNWRLYERKQR